MSAQAQFVPRVRPAARVAWPFLVLFAIMGVLYAPVLRLLVLHWWEDPDFSHGFLIPLFAAWVAWEERQRWQAAERRPSNLGLVAILAAMAMLVAGTLGAELFLARTSLLVLFAGLLLFVEGPARTWVVAFPLASLALMIPLPAIIYNQITFPLQLMASKLAATALDWTPIPVLREGNVLVLPNAVLEIVEACSGVRSLLALFALAVIYGHIRRAGRVARLVFLAVVPPIAVLSNAFRVFLTGVLTYRFGSLDPDGFLHLALGWLVFISALALLLACDWGMSAASRRLEARHG